MLIYSNGCSHSIGIGSHFAWSQIVSKGISKSSNYLIDIYLKNFNTFDSNTFYNFADSGKGNDLIFIETLQFLNKCKNQGIKPDYVFIQWSGPSRFATQKYDGTLKMFTPSDDDIELLSFEPFASERTLSFIYALQEIFIKENIEYYFCCYMDLDKSILDSTIYKNIDLSKFISFDKNSHPMLDGFRIKMIEKGYVLDANGHPSFFGHYYLANKFLDIMNVPNISIGFFETLPPRNRIVFGKLLKTELHFITYYMDNMLSKKKAIEYTKNGILKHGSREEKNEIRKSLL